MVALSKEEVKEAKEFGYSFDSKKVAQGPTFFNLRVMCECYGKAVMKHIEFAESTGEDRWFLDEEISSFTHDFKDNLKLTTDFEKAKAMRPPEEAKDITEEDSNEFYT